MIITILFIWSESQRDVIIVSLQGVRDVIAVDELFDCIPAINRFCVFLL